MKMDVTDPEKLKRFVETMMRERGGVLSGKELYASLGEQAEDNIREVMRVLQKDGVITIKGNIEPPLGVFESVYLMSPASRRQAS